MGIILYISLHQHADLSKISLVAVCKKKSQVARTIHSLQLALTLKPLPAKRETGATDTGMTSHRIYAAEVLLWWQGRLNAGHGEDGLLGMISFYGRTGPRWQKIMWHDDLADEFLKLEFVVKAQLSSLRFALPRQLYSYSYDKVVSCRWRSMGENTSLSTLSSCISADFNMKLYHQAPRSHKSWRVACERLSGFTFYPVSAPKGWSQKERIDGCLFNRCKEWTCRYTAVCLLIEMWDCLPILVSAAISPQRTKIFNNTLDEEQQTLRFSGRGLVLHIQYHVTYPTNLNIRQSWSNPEFDLHASSLTGILVYYVLHDQLVDIWCVILYIIGFCVSCLVIKCATWKNHAEWLVHQPALCSMAVIESSPTLLYHSNEPQNKVFTNNTHRNLTYPILGFSVLRSNWYKYIYIYTLIFQRRFKKQPFP